MLKLTVSQPTNGLVVNPHAPFPVTGQVTDRGLSDPAQIDSVTIQVDNGPPIEATLTPVPHQNLTMVTFSATAEVNAAEGTVKLPRELQPC